MKRTGSPSVGFVSLGCAKNLVDSEYMVGVLRAQGLVIAPSPDEADVVLVNTCSFIRDATEESIEAVLRACRARDAGACRAVIVAGCLAQRYKGALRGALPEVDAFMGLDELDRVGEIARKAAAGQGGILEVSRAVRRVFEPTRPRILLTGGAYAYVKIAEGCHHRCSFCVIPRIRGRYRSRPLRRIVAEAESLLDNGVRELVLISQDVTAYGRDLGDGTDLPRLLRAIGRIGGKFWLRIMYGHPAAVTDRLLETMGEVSQVCRYLDVPIQHSHPAILRAMQREETIRAVETLPARARRILPGVTLRTTCLVGFPGEREEHFEHLLDYVRAAQFEHLGAFAYSPEDGTPAARLGTRVSAATAARRRERLMLLQRGIARERNRVQIGRIEEVLVERRNVGKGIWIGRSRRQAPEVDGEVRITGLPGATCSSRFVRVCFASVRRSYDLEAKVVRTERTA